MIPWRNALAELAAKARALLCTVVGSGIRRERWQGGNVAIALLANTLATVFALYVLIEVFGPLSGAHFHPAVSVVMALRRELPAASLGVYVAAQLTGCDAGCLAGQRHVRYERAPVEYQDGAAVGQWLAELVATSGLVLVILRAPAGKAAHGWPATSALLLVHGQHLVRQPRRFSVACSATALPGSPRQRDWLRGGRVDRRSSRCFDLSIVAPESGPLRLTCDRVETRLRAKRHGYRPLAASVGVRLQRRLFDRSSMNGG
jgi:hypothetical protein